MVKINQISGRTGKKLIQRLAAVLIVILIAVLFWEYKKESIAVPEAACPSAEGFCELPVVNITTADNQKFGLKIAVKPHLNADFRLISDAAAKISGNIAASLKRYPYRDLAPQSNPHLLHKELRKQINRAIAPRTVKDIIFSRLPA